MQSYCENCKKHTERPHPKILVLISNKKAKVKSKYAECLTDRTFFDKINDEYELECRKITENLNSKVFKRKNSRLVMQSKCTDYGIK